MARIVNRPSRVPELIAGFRRYLSIFEDNPPFTRAGQLEFHLETMRLRQTLGSAESAIADDDFLLSLYRTLQAWGIGARASNLVPLPVFTEALRARATDIAAFDNLAIDDLSLKPTVMAAELWRTIRDLSIIENDSRIVPGTKALHHILPELVVPIDRAYTQKFFRWHNPEFQYGQREFFEHAFTAFVKIARSASPHQYVNQGWNSSRTKVIDNAIVGMLLAEARRNAS